MGNSHREIAAPLRLLWLLAGLISVGLGSIGILVPGLPTTVFFIVAAACFTRSSPRLERWVLGLPGIGKMVQDYRSGLGMPRRAKIAAVASIVGFSLLAIVVIASTPARIIVALAAAIGVSVILGRIPTRERVLAQGGDASGA